MTGIVALGLAAALSVASLALPDLAGVPAAQAPMVRELDWDGSSRLTFNLGANATFIQGSPARVVVSGDPAIVPHVIVQDGRITVDPAWAREQRGRWSRGPLDITVTAPSVNQFVFNSGGRFQIRGYAQDDLSLTVNGSGPVSVAGAVDAIACRVNGSASVDLAGLKANTARIRIAGRADMTVAARDLVDVDIVGHGVVQLLNRPGEVKKRIVGSGAVLGG